MKQRLNYLLIIVITLIGGCMRLYNMSEMSLMNDELSALMRTRFDNFHDLIYKGIATEGHPAGVQLFLFVWVKVFGESAFALRFPFAVAGTLCIPLIYFVGTRWFNKTTGLFAALSFALLQFTILYSQLARMYAAGMFAVLLFSFCLTLLFFSTEKLNRNLWRVVYILSAAGCLYTHYFAALVMMIIMVCALPVLIYRQKSIGEFLILNAISLALFIPHIPLFFTQFGLGGVGGPDGWLPPPDENTWRKFLAILFNDSNTIYYLFVLTMVVTFVVRRKKIDFNPFHLITLLVVIIPFAAGYFYSVYRNPVLQVTGMLFSFPFLLMFMFSFMPQRPAESVLAMLMVFGSILFYHTVFENKYYSTDQFGQYKKPAEWCMKFDEKFGIQNITHVCNTPNGDYFKYYFDRAGKKFSFERTLVNSDSTLNLLKQLVEKSNTPYFLFMYSNMFTPEQTENVIRNKFPFTVFKEEYFNSGFMILSQQPVGNTSMTLLHQYNNDFENVNENIFGLNMDSVYKTSGNYAADIDGKEFALDYALPASVLKNQKQIIITASLNAMAASDSCKAVLVISADGKGKNVLWKGSEFNQLKSKNVFEKITCTSVLPIDKSEIESVKIYVWNRQMEKILIDDYNIRVEVVK